MTTTGTASFSMTRDQVSSAALRALRVLQDGQVASVAQLNTCAEAMNIVLKNAQSAGLQLWTYQLIQIPCQTNKTTYTIGSTGADITNVRPLRIFPEGNFVRFASGGQNYDTPLNLLSRQEYMNMGNKGSTGIVNSLYYFPGIDLSTGKTSPSTGYGTLYVYVSPMDTTRTVFLNAQRPIYDVSTGTDEIDFPQEWNVWLKWQVAAEVADEFEVPEARLQRVEAKAKYYHDQLQDWSVENAPFMIQPDFRMGASW